MQDIRWKQRFNNYQRAFQTLKEAVELAESRALTPLEKQGLIQSFEFTHELAWNVFKDFLEEKGIQGVVGSKDATREAFKNGLIADGADWMKMIQAGNLALQSYDTDVAGELVYEIRNLFCPAFERMAIKFTALRESEDQNV